MEAASTCATWPAKGEPGQLILHQRFRRGKAHHADIGANADAWVEARGSEELAEGAGRSPSKTKGARMTAPAVGLT